MPITYNARGGEDATYLRNYLGSHLAIQGQLQEQKNQAIRWQGARDYDTLVQSGVDPRKALQRTAPKLFFNDPRALAATVPSMLSQTGRLTTDPQTGRQFTVDRFGNYKAVPQRPTGYTSYTDERGQRISRPIRPGEPLASGQAPPSIPRAERGPYGQLYFPQPGGRAPVPARRDAVTIANAKEALTRAQSQADKILTEYRKVEADQAGGETKYNYPDFLFGGQPIQKRLDKLAKELEQLGFDTQGRILPDSALYNQVYGEPAIAPVAPPQGILPPGQIGPQLPPGRGLPPAAVPPPSGGLPPAPLVPPRGLPSQGPVRPPVRTLAAPRPGGGFRRVPGPAPSRQAIEQQRQRQLRGATAPAPAAAPVQPRGTQLGPNEVIKYRKDNGEPVVVNTATGARRPYAQ